MRSSCSRVGEGARGPLSSRRQRDSPLTALACSSPPLLPCACAALVSLLRELSLQLASIRRAASVATGFCIAASGFFLLATLLGPGPDPLAHPLHLFDPLFPWRFHLFCLVHSWC